MLISNSLQRQLPTIRSRCQAVWFRGLSDQQLAQLLVGRDGQRPCRSPAVGRTGRWQSGTGAAVARCRTGGNPGEPDGTTCPAAATAENWPPSWRQRSTRRARRVPSNASGSLLLGFAAALYRQLTLLQLAGDQVDPAAWRPIRSPAIRGSRSYAWRLDARRVSGPGLLASLCAGYRGGRSQRQSGGADPKLARRVGYLEWCLTRGPRRPPKSAVAGRRRAPRRLGSVAWIDHGGGLGGHHRGRKDVRVHAGRDRHLLWDVGYQHDDVVQLLARTHVLNDR